MADSIPYDVAIVGGGVVGCAVLFELTNQGYRCLLLEKNPHLVAEASSGNSGMLHTGFDTETGSVELQSIKECQSRIYSVLEKLGCPIQKIGAVMVAWNQSELNKLPTYLDKARVAAVSDVSRLSASQLYQKEPGLSPGAQGGLWIPGESIIDPWLLAIMMAETARQKKSTVITNALVTSVDCSNQTYCVVTTSAGNFRSKCIINCAGLYGDVVEKLGGFDNFQIKPRKGQYTVYNRTANSLINASLLPVPDERTKGIIVFKSVYGNVIVGPTAEDVDTRTKPPVDRLTSERLVSHATSTVGRLLDHNIVGSYVGVRPATQYRDYVIKADTDRRWVTVGGIRSTGVSGCLGIANKVHELVKASIGTEPSKAPDFTLPRQEVHFTKYGTAVVGHNEYTVTHPITIFGNEGVASRI